jgi:hypothetical protein
MTRRTFSLPAILGLLLGAAPARGEEPVDPVLVVQVKPLAEVLTTAKEVARNLATPQLGNRAGPETARLAEQEVVSFLGKDWRKSIDASKPVVLYAVPAADVAQSTVVLLLPVKSEEGFLGLLAGRGIRPEQSDDGGRRFRPPGFPLPVHFRFVGGYVCASLNRAAPLAAGRLLSPRQLFDARERAAVAVRLHVDRVPKEVKTLVLSHLRQGIEEGTRADVTRGPEVVKKNVKQLGADVLAWARMGVLDGKELTLRFNLDADTCVASGALGLTALPRSRLAETVAGLRPTPSVAAGLLSGRSMASVQVKTWLPVQVGNVFISGIHAGTQEAAGMFPDAQSRRAFVRLVEVLRPTVEAGTLDAAVSLRGPTKEERYAVVAGLRLKDSAAVQQALRDFHKALPENAPGRQLRLDAATVGTVKVHRLPLGAALPAAVQGLFGPGDLWLAFREDAIFLAFGDGAKDQLREALTSRPKPLPPVAIHAEADSKQTADVVARLDERNAARIKEYFALAGDRLEVLHLSLSGGEGLQVRAAVNLLLLPRAAARRGAAAPPGRAPGRR